MIVKTKNSVYEIGNNKIRIIEGKVRPNTGITDKWRKFGFIPPVRVGNNMIIFWDSQDDYYTQTRTSKVLSIERNDCFDGWVHKKGK